ERDLDPVALYHYLTFMATPAPHTMFKGVSKLPAGHCMTVEGDGTARVRRWWDLADAPRPAAELLASEAASVEHVRTLLGNAVQGRLMADVRFGVFLSGGVDSSAITALVRRHHSGTLRTFSVGYSDAPEHDESGPARA